MAQIGSIYVALKAQTGQFMGAMQRAQASVGGFASGVLRAVNPLAGLLTAGALGGGLAALVKDSMEAIDATGKMADRLGLSTEAMAALQHGAALGGVGVELLEQSMKHMLLSLADGGKQFESLGLSAQKLSGMAGEDALGQIVDAINQLPSAADRAATAVQIFGRGGLSVLNAFTTQGIRAAAAEARRLGLTFSQLDFQRVQAANDALTTMQASVKGIGTQLAIAVAPLLQAIAQDFTALGESAGNSLQQIEGRTAGLSEAFANVASALDIMIRVVRGAFLSLAGVIETIVLAQAAVIEKIASLAAKLPKLLGGGVAEDVRALAAAVREGLSSDLESKRQSFAGLFQTPLLGDRMRQIADSGEVSKRAAAAAAAKLGADIAASTAELEQQIATFGMAADASKRYELALRGATAGQLAAFDASAQRLKALRQEDSRKQAAAAAAEALKGRAKSVFDQTRTPLERFQAEVGDLDKMVRHGLITWDTYRRAVTQAGGALEQAAEIRLPAATFAGTAEAVSAVARLEAPRMRSDANERIAKLLAESKEIEKKQLETAQKIAASIAGGLVGLAAI